MASPANSPTLRHPAFVRVTHWLTVLAFAALVLSGVEILISHPRFYWGDTGHSSMPALFQLPIPASRGHVPTGFKTVLPDQNGWSRSLHFEAAWLVAFTGLVYGLMGLASRHLQRQLMPSAAELQGPALARVLRDHLRFARPEAEYNVLQRLAYLIVVFIAFPLMIWTGLAMSPAIVSLFPSAMAVFGGHQSARTLHFFGFGLLMLFLVAHVAMVIRAGFRQRVGAMMTGGGER